MLSMNTKEAYSRSLAIAKLPLAGGGKEAGMNVWLTCLKEGGYYVNANDMEKTVSIP